MKQTVALSFKQYMVKHGYSSQATQGYGYTINAFLTRNQGADQFGYSDVLGYMDELGKTYLKMPTLITRLNAIKKYYDYLIEEGIREDHPCKRLYLKTKSKRGVIQSDLFSITELEGLLDREEHFTCLKVKHQVVVSFFIYQGLLPGEITRLKLHHIDLDAGTVFVKGGKQLTARKLEIHPRQQELLDQYLNHDRKRLLKKGENGFLLLNLLGNNEKPESIVNCIETMKYRFPDRNLTAVTIRDSVISHLLNEQRHPLEHVQTFAGHRWICSTQRYYQAPAEDERDVMNRYNPLEQ